MDNLSNFFSSIENGSLRLNLSMSNDLRTFVINLKTSSEYVNAKNLIKADIQFFGEKLIDRISKICNIEYDKSYLHPYDITIASYLYLSSEIDIELCSKICKIINQSGLVNVWWTSQMLEYLNITTNFTNTETKTIMFTKMPILENEDKINTNTKTRTIILN